MCCVLALAGFETAICLIDDIDAALATHDPAITVPVLERAERVSDLHDPVLIRYRRDCAL